MIRSLMALALIAGLPLAAGAATKAPVKKTVVTKRAPAKVNWVNVVAATPEGGMRMGNPNAKVKLIEYGSRTCPHCALFDKEGLPVLKAGPIAAGTLSYEFRDYPVHGAFDLGPILLGHCVPPAQFFPLLDAMFANQQALTAKAQAAETKIQAMTNPTPNQIATSFATDLGYVDFVKRRGMAPARAQACLAARAGVDRVVAVADAAGKQYSVTGTPTFVINGTKADNVYDWAHLQPLLAAAGV
ncbi:thioredoxin domain-containing protein [Sphingomonas asaccharolytica]|uniref:thioredoxin domain-containing protein n=1 Tax=Sphingomonas asaccharolytica TaxID=40681 RepID=UPI000837047E|nr:thioredoxin domain-containing protein [Sphingomonas asaccharolytica]